jgi:hypothetical protein
VEQVVGRGPGTGLELESKVKPPNYLFAGQSESVPMSLSPQDSQLSTVVPYADFPLAVFVMDTPYIKKINEDSSKKVDESLPGHNCYPRYDHTDLY